MDNVTASFQVANATGRDRFRQQRVLSHAPRFVQIGSRFVGACGGRASPHLNARSRHWPHVGPQAMPQPHSGISQDACHMYTRRPAPARQISDAGGGG